MPLRGIALIQNRVDNIKMDASMNKARVPVSTQELLTMPKEELLELIQRNFHNWMRGSLELQHLHSQFGVPLPDKIELPQNR